MTETSTIAPSTDAAHAAPVAFVEPPRSAEAVSNGVQASGDVPANGGVPANGYVLASGGAPSGDFAANETRACTAAQLRRFIKSRPYVPMHELRRRFELNGASDDVTRIETSSGAVYVGLPQREATFISDLVAQGDVGLELCRDPFVPIVVGVYAMRPISRQ